MGTFVLAKRMLRLLVLVLFVACTRAGPVKPNIVEAPAEFIVEFRLNVRRSAPVKIHVVRRYAPIGVDRFYELLTLDSSCYTMNSFFNVRAGEFARFGISGNTTLSQEWRNNFLAVDPAVLPYTRGSVLFAQHGVRQIVDGVEVQPSESRSTQLYISLENKTSTFSAFGGSAPIGMVVEGMDVVDQIFTGYGENPVRASIYELGDAYLTENYPSVTYITATTITQPRAE